MCRPDDYPPYELHAEAMAEANRAGNLQPRTCPACVAVLERHAASHPDGTGCGCLDALPDLHRAHPPLYVPGGDPPIPALHAPATLTGGAVPAHVPGAYPRLSCCGGPVQLVPVDDPDGPPAPVVPEGPGWSGHGPNFDDRSDCAFATVYLEPQRGDGATRAELYITARPDDPCDEPREIGTELTLDDLAALVIRACEIGAEAATTDESHFFAVAFDRAREHLERVTA